MSATLLLLRTRHWGCGVRLGGGEWQERPRRSRNSARDRSQAHVSCTTAAAVQEGSD